MEVDSSSNFESIKNGPRCQISQIIMKTKVLQKEIHQWEMFNLYLKRFFVTIPWL